MSDMETLSFLPDLVGLKAQSTLQNAGGLCPAARSPVSIRQQLVQPI
jgi:hypothetical protein